MMLQTRLRLNDQDHAPAREALHAEVREGLSRAQKTLPSKLLYDQRGSDLFELITQLDEYYPARTEVQILRRHARAIGAWIGPHAVLIEPGSGFSKKIRTFLPSVRKLEAYVPIEISKDALFKGVSELRREFPDLEVIPV